MSITLNRGATARIVRTGHIKLFQSVHIARATERHDCRRNHIRRELRGIFYLGPEVHRILVVQGKIHPALVGIFYLVDNLKLMVQLHSIGCVII